MPAANHSRLVRRVRRRYKALLHCLPAGTPTRARMQTCLDALQAREACRLADALRILRHLTLERLAVLDCEQGASLQSICTAMTALAELALDAACQQAFAQLDARHGAPMTLAREPARMWIIGMGKLGGRELNISSDIDLVYVYDADGQTLGRDGHGVISTREYFTRVARELHRLIGASTEHGLVFRMDLALRPNGASGAPVCSLPTLSNYLLRRGREWERFAWLKSRVVAPHAYIRDGSGQALRPVILPFVFRRYLDYNVFEALRELHQQIRVAHAQEGQDLRSGNVKLGRGGIREIEFIVQLQQVVRGGQFPELRTRATLQALPRLAQAGLISRKTAQELQLAYTFLRRLEHRIQYLDDQQSHIVPGRIDDLDWMALTMGLADRESLLARLEEHRQRVIAAFDAVVLGHAEAAAGAVVPVPTGQPDQQHPAEPAPVLPDSLQQWLDQVGRKKLPQASLDKLQRLLQATAELLAAGRVTPASLPRFTSWVDSLLGRDNYLALLLERPAVHEHILHLCAASRWPMRYLALHPAVMDELAQPALLDARFDPGNLERKLGAQHAALGRTGEDSDGNLMALLRRAQHIELFRTLVRDVEGRLSVEQVADDLSALADSILRVALQWCWQDFPRRHRELPQLAVIAYGKLGGKELGYGSDLDLVFVFDDEHPQAAPIYAALVRRLISWLTEVTREGGLYEVDTALRPYGQSGLPVTHFSAYADYQQRRGSNTAWTWEHQAMTRARMLPPNPLLSPSSPMFDLPDRFDAVRHAVITAPRDLAAMRSEIAHMRETIARAHPIPAGRFDIKHSPGGLIDAEFVTQYLVLAHSRQHPGLEANLGNISLLQQAEDVGLLPPGTGRAAASAYRSLRRAQHRARMDDQPTQVDPALLAEQRRAITTLWSSIFGPR